jgi:uncharacterized membrane protein YtjA (UPF0391 family)
MLRAALGFFVLALIALFFGATGIAGVSLDVGKLLLLVFLALSVLSVVAGLVTGRGPNNIP